tara:strand:- start:470 stop:889 length:420 start_codon:yes stop_codon:yes gene_type:complete
LNNIKNSIVFNHFGLAVRNFDKPIIFYNNLGYKCTKPVIDARQNVELILCTSDKYPTVELVKPINNQSPVNNYLKKSSEIIYHSCYEIDDINSDLKYIFSGNRALYVCGPDPTTKLFKRRLASFYHVDNVGLIEILHDN